MHRGAQGLRGPWLGNTHIFCLYKLVLGVINTFSITII